MAELLWTGEELQTALKGETQGVIPQGVTGISIDTRTLQPGELFFAIKGDRTDGHDYIGQAFAAGAALAVVRKDFDSVAPGPLLRVADTLEALNALARAARGRSAARIVAVTGSVGKTGTKEMLRLMLGRLGSVHASDKSYNNHWGVPLSLARLPCSADYAVFEIGMNHAGEIGPLARLVHPHAAIITTIAPVHIEFFEGIEDIAAAKAEIFEGLEARGTAILNLDNAQYALLSAYAREYDAGRIIAFGRDSRAQSRLVSLAAAENGSRIEADCLGERLSYRIGAPGEHLALNSLAALAAVNVLGGDAKLAATALAKFSAPQGRGAQTAHQIGDGSFVLIDEAYNANPASMAAAFKVLGNLPQARASRRIAVLGDMLELGAESKMLHVELAPAIEAAGIDLVYCCGPHMAALFEALPATRRGAWAENSDKLKETLLAAVRADDAVMIKGSLGSRMGLLVDALKQRFPQAGQTQPAAAE